MGEGGGGGYFCMKKMEILGRRGDLHEIPSVMVFFWTYTFWLTFRCSVTPSFRILGDFPPFHYSVIPSVKDFR